MWLDVKPVTWHLRSFKSCLLQQAGRHHGHTGTLSQQWASSPLVNPYIPASSVGVCFFWYFLELPATSTWSPTIHAEYQDQPLQMTWEAGQDQTPWECHTWLPYSLSSPEAPSSHNALMGSCQDLQWKDCSRWCTMQPGVRQKNIATWQVHTGHLAHYEDYIWCNASGNATSYSH